VAIRQRLASDNPSVVELQLDLARSQVNFGNRLNDMGHAALALESFQSAQAIGERIARDNPTITEFQRELGASLVGIGEIYSKMAQPTQALESYRKSLAIWERLTHDNPADHSDRSALGITLQDMAEIEMGQRRWQNARELLERASQSQRAALAAMPGDPAIKRALCALLLDQTKVCQAQQQPDEAVRLVREALSLPRLGASDFYNAACALASSVPITHGEKKQDVAALAVVTLERAIAAGWNNAAKTSRDPNLAPLRDREDFRRLLSKLFDRGFPADPFARPLKLSVSH
jgi:tetratricopeptide (TPR) repeat protein